ncbi:MAG: MerR family transcriptional regulator [Deltaproteobacteria bacterium]|jgi:DNA-binding transcriptional MerR regulator/methylmalonyl-CoA mutase cobalamin-binding subunit|nr:MerR family transcriptional regulator [Deltaproteobacteria bacterium]
MKNQIPVKKIYTITLVARRCGLSTAIIRAWEQRYQAVRPKRSSSNRRLYSEKDILRLQLLKRAVDSGHRISQVANLPSEELLRLINANKSVNAAIQSCSSLSTDADYFFKRALKSVLQLNSSELKRTLEQASVHLTKLQLINTVIVPLGKRIGELWRRGNLKIINEHLATPVIRSVMWNLMDSLEVAPEAPRIVIATPLNHRHEMGALAISLIARESGWRSCYFGANLPADEIAAAVISTDARAVALSITFSLDQRQLVDEVKKLRHLLSKDITVFVGGQGAPSIIDEIDNENVQLLVDLESLSVALDNLLRRGYKQRVDN